MLSTEPTCSKPPLLSRRAQNLLLAIACLLPVLAYQRSFRAGFVYDDVVLIIHNPNVLSLHGWTTLFYQPMWGFMHGATEPYYRPITLLFFSVEYYLFGAQPLGWHLTSIFLHMAATGLVFLTGNAVLKNRTAAVFAALLFGVYPIHAEVASWVIAANESLLAISLLAAFGGFVLSYEKEHGTTWYCLSLVLAAAALLIKETAVILPLVVFWYVFTRSGRGRKWGSRMLQASVGAAPYSLLVAILFLIRWRVVQQPLGEGVQPLLSRLPGLLLLDLRQLVWPFQLSVFYNPVPTLPIGFSIAVIVVSSAAFLALLLWSCCRHATLAFLLFWTVIALLPSALVINPYLQLQDRFLYLSSVAVCWAGGWFISRATSGPLRLRTYACTAVGLIVAVFATASFVESSYWKNEILLFGRAAKIAPRNPLALNSYAMALIHANRNREGLAMLQSSMALDAEQWDTLKVMGALEIKLGDFSNAEQHLAKAEAALGGNDTTEFVVMHRLRASIALQLKDWNKAEQLLREALARDPDNKMLRDELVYCLQNARQGNQRRQSALASQNARVRAAKTY